MSRRWNLFIRAAGGIALAVVGYQAGATLVDTPLSAGVEESQAAVLVSLLMAIGLALAGFALGYLLTPIVLRPLDIAYRELRDVPPVQMTGALIGLALGLLLSTLVALPLSFLPSPFGSFLPFFAAIAFGYLGTVTVGNNPSAYLGVMGSVLSGTGEAEDRGVLLDTSVIIDGRVADVAETGFLGDRLLVPRFVLGELQAIADSADTLRRNRGRRGLEVLNRLQHSKNVSVEILDQDVSGAPDVDRKLVRLAERLGCAVMTNDYNLNRVAEIEGIAVLNLNELANAVKTLLLPGEQLMVHLIQEGKEYGQGVGYLEDGTMVVVEQGRDHIEETLPVTVTRVLQTVAGRMIFAQLASDAGGQPSEGAQE